MPELPELHLFSESLLSKWGFNDGDTPDHVLDYCEDRGIDYNAWDWHDVLRRLVRKHLLPELEKNHTIELVDVECCHNPIRASKVDGVDVSDEWYMGGDAITQLTPDGVSIPMEDVVRAFAEVS